MPANDDTDDILRAAMKTLDDETPSGYFDALPSRTLVRLEGSMQTTSSGTDRSDAELPMSTANEREEDSGLHDIRSLASSQRQRLSSRRLGTNPPPVDEDILSSTSGSWKSIALPEPAKMVALPEIAELPSKVDIKAQQKAEKAAAKTRSIKSPARPSGEINQNDIPLAAAPSSSTSMPSMQASLSGSSGGLALAVNATVSEAPIHLPAHEEIPSLAAGTAKGATALAAGTAKGATSVAAPVFGARIAGVQSASSSKNSRGALIGVLGLGLAVAAGVIIYVTTRGDDTAKSDTTTAAQPDPTLRVKAPEPEPAKPAAVVAPVVDEPKIDDAKVAAPDPVPVDPTPAKSTKTAKPTVGKKPGKQLLEVVDPGNGVKPVDVKKDETKKPPPKEGDPDFEQLLKDSGYQKKQDDKPKLEKTSLSGGDFKNGMAAISGRAQACYKGTQGTASVKLTIASSGAVSKVTVTGVGAAEAACVQAAVRGATFPAWDGGPQSFGYSYLLSE